MQNSYRGWHEHDVQRTTLELLGGAAPGLCAFALAPVEQELPCMSPVAGSKEQ